MGYAHIEIYSISAALLIISSFLCVILFYKYGAGLDEVARKIGKKAIAYIIPLFVLVFSVLVAWVYLHDSWRDVAMILFALGIVTEINIFLLVEAKSEVKPKRTERKQ